MVAAATRINLAKKKVAHKQRAKHEDWQDEGWEYFDEVPEIKYSFWFSGNAMAKLRIYAAVQPADPEAEPIPVSDPASGIPPALAARAEAEIARLKGPLGGQPEILRALNMNLDVAAECYLVGIGPREVVEQDPETGEDITYITPEAWSIRSIAEVREQGGVYKIASDDSLGGGDELDPELDFICRIWQRHPKNQNEPDCNMRGVLNDCEALVLLTNQVKAEAKSRQSAGAFTVPSELSFGGELDEPAGEGEETPDPFDEELLAALTEPIEDPSSASAVMPMVIRGPAEYLKADVLRHISFARDMTAVLEERIKARIERIARGLNLPVEVVMGHQQTTFSNAEQIDEDTYEDHFEPRATLICDGLTVGFLRPQLHDAADLAGYGDLIDQIFVWGDPSRIIGTPDPSESADVGHDKLLISDEAWRRTKGWSDDDAPDALELLTRAGLRRGILTADLTKALLEMLGIPITVEALPQATPAAPGAAGLDSRAGLLLLLMEAFGGQAPGVATGTGQKALTAAGRNAPGARLAAIDRELRTRLLVAADRALERALERAGNRLKSKAGATRTQLKSVLPVYAAATLGPTLVAAAGFTDAELIGDEAWDALERQFMEWGANAQEEALAVATKLTGFTVKQRDALKLRQAQDLPEAWAWMKEALTGLAHRALYHPDPHAVALGEFDPTSRVPTGLVREAIARAGGVNAIQPVGDKDAFVSVKNGGQPLGGIGTGDLLTDAMKDEGVQIEAYEWDYGSAHRQAPFEEHLALAGQIFTDFNDPSLSSANADWIPGTGYFPGDHAGCACDLIPILVAPEDIGQTTQGPNE